jgi:hypothetical protein
MPSPASLTNATTTTAAGQRLSQIAELLELIISHLTTTNNKQSLKSCALVSRLFSRIALSELWKEVDNIISLFKLLGALELVQHKMEFGPSFVVRLFYSLTHKL